MISYQSIDFPTVVHVRLSIGLPVQCLRNLVDAPIVVSAKHCIFHQSLPPNVGVDLFPTCCNRPTTAQSEEPCVRFSSRLISVEASVRGACCLLILKSDRK